MYFSDLDIEDLTCLSKNNFPTAHIIVPRGKINLSLLNNPTFLTNEHIYNVVFAWQASPPQDISLGPEQFPLVQHYRMARNVYM